MAPEPTPKEKKPEEKKKAKPREYNTLWKGYMFILLSSLINLSAASNVSKELSVLYHGRWQLAVIFGSVTFALAFLILLFDRTGWLNEKLGDFKKAYDGKLEGGVLAMFIVWWVIGVGYQTQVDGISYTAINVYFSAWMSLASCIYTLNKWSTAKDILSIDELTSVSETLPSWYVLFFGSMVVLGTSVNVLYRTQFGDFESEAYLGMALGIASLIICLFWILVHYNFIEIIKEGGWLEVVSSFVAVLLWIVGAAVLTQEGAIAATLVGSGCQTTDAAVLMQSGNFHNCTVKYVDSQGMLHYEPCTAVLEQDIPGSNLYWGVWLCLAASLHIAFRWKQQQAQNFAQAQQAKAAKSPQIESAMGSESADDDADDLDDFHDAQG